MGKLLFLPYSAKKNIGTIGIRKAIPINNKVFL
jgi:hypothetical protein